YARQGLEIARQLGSTLFEAVAHIRAGHALQLLATPDQPAANAAYLHAMALADSLDVERTKAEAYLGLTLLHGFGGDLPAARAAAAIALAQRHNYTGLLTTATLFGPRDRMMLVPLLLAGRGDVRWSTIARELLARGFPAIATDDVTQTYHPGVTLRIQAFGQLR